MSDETTHYENCWQSGAKHYECALQEMNRLLVNVEEFMSKAWVGLTEEEFKKIMLDTYNIDLNVPGHFSDDHLLWAAIESKLEEKNT